MSDLLDKPTASKKLSAASQSALSGVYTRNLADWLEREDDGLLDCVMADPREKKSKSKSSKPLRLDDFAVKFSRDPVLIMRHLIDSDMAEMAGIDMVWDSEEACEFVGLALAGVPLSLALRWCAADEDQADRPQWLDIAASMTGPDRRGAMRLVMNSGLWFTSSAQLWALDMLCDQDEADVGRAVLAVIERLDAPTPDVVSQQMFGAFEDDEVVNWARIKKSGGQCFMTDMYAMPGACVKKGRGRRSSYGSGSVNSTPGSADYSANAGNWGGKKKTYYRKRRASGGSRTIKAGTSYTSVKGKAKYAKSKSSNAF